MEERTYQITLIYHVSADENRLTRNRENWEPEHIERFKQLLHTILSSQQVTDFFMLKEAGYELGYLGEEGIPELLTGLNMDDNTPIETIVKTLSLEDQRFFGDIDNTRMTLNEAFQATLDHIHINRIDQHLNAQLENQPTDTKQRHHKRKVRRKT